MMNDNLPQVILFQEDEKARNYKYIIPFELNSDVAVKSIEDDVEDFKNGEVKLVGPPPTKDAIYYLHPYKDKEYVHESLGEMYFLEEKLELYKRVGYLLGAKSISTKVILTESKKLEIDIEGKVQVNTVNAGANVNNSKQSKYKETLEISEKYNQKENFDLNRNIDELKDMTQTLNLHHETGIKSLIDARDSRNSGVELSERKVKSEISSEYNRLLKISAQLSSPVFSVGIDFKNSLKTLNTLNVDIEFVF